jgi:hypothetical protein
MCKLAYIFRHILQVVEHAGWSPTEGDNSKKVLTSKDDNFFRKIVLNLAGHFDHGALLVIVIYRAVMAFEKKLVSVISDALWNKQTYTVAQTAATDGTYKQMN